MRFSVIQQSFFFGLLILVSVTFIWLIRDFILPIFWAVVFGIIFYPIHERWLTQTRNRASLASVLTILTILISIILPLFIVGSLVVTESIGYYREISGAQSSGDIRILERIIVASERLETFGIDKGRIESAVFGAAESIGNWFASQALSFGQNTFRFLLLLFVMLYILFFILRDGPAIEKRLLDVLPLGDAKEKRLIKRFISTTRATIKGTFVIALIQGTIGGILFFVTGVNAPILWGTLMGLLSIIPAIGPGLVWLPAGLILLFTGNVWQGVVILVGGGVIISFVDNLLRPPLVGKDTQMPDVLILLSTLGGLSLFGISGFIIGPIITAFFLAMWHMFEEEYRKDLEKYG